MQIRVPTRLYLFKHLSILYITTKLNRRTKHVPIYFYVGCTGSCYGLCVRLNYQFAFETKSLLQRKLIVRGHHSRSDDEEARSVAARSSVTEQTFQRTRILVLLDHHEGRRSPGSGPLARVHRHCAPGKSDTKNKPIRRSANPFVPARLKNTFAKTFWSTSTHT